jgi:hypothetical protein
MAKEKGWKFQLRSQAKNSEGSVASPSARPDKFDEATFHRFLVRFIVADDQVGSPLTILTVLTFLPFPILKAINLVECPEFRQLLILLRSDLKDATIPHRTKLRELVIDGWKQRFQVLRRELEVSLPLLGSFPS